MKIINSKIIDVKIIEADVFKDSRGFFLESYSSRKFAQLGIMESFIQDNHSLSSKKGTLRGLHFQKNPHAQAKLIRCTRGRVLDVAVDIRVGSPTFLRLVSAELSEDNFRQLYIPKGFAHGFLTLADNVEVQYKTSDYYAPDSDMCIRWDDPDIGVIWGTLDPVLSEKDRHAPYFREIYNNFIY